MLTSGHDPPSSYSVTVTVRDSVQLQTPKCPLLFGFLNTGGSGQIGNYSNPQADALINASVTGSDPAAVTNEASFFTTQVPVLWQPVLDYTWAWKVNISATDPTAFENLTQYDNTPQFWYLTK